MSSISSELPFGLDLSRCVVTADELVTITNLLGKDVAVKLLGQADTMASLAFKFAPLMYGTARSNASSSIRSGSDSNIGSTGLTGARLAAIRGVDKWRRFEDGASSGVCKNVPDGFCYAKLFNKASAESATVRLGSFPNFSSVVRTRISAFQSLEALERFRLVDRGAGVYHVEAGGSQGQSFLAAVARYAGGVTLPEHTLGGAVKSAGVSSLGATWVGGRALVGADGGLSGIKSVLATYGVQVDLVPAVVWGIVGKSAAMLDSGEKRKLRMLAAHGDASLTRFLSQECVKEGFDTQAYQDARSRCTSATSLSGLFCRTFGKEALVVPSGVSVEVGRVGAEAFEALVGAVDYYAGELQARRFIVGSGFLTLS